ncbi:hypothetical protein SCLARK_00566 [Spiroplasma clarkii]|uniref:hypothetical protein n=1 Tax=Spiroplasma clarkii TaxID=2139 RepID=UPI000B5801DD|nr:hypothetical protein [Spiroplasma clarkii]ARU91248.1 hypothetical protein SCLARK_00566 [Spiroplasma clarkii]
MIGNILTSLLIKNYLIVSEYNLISIFQNKINTETLNLSEWVFSTITNSLLLGMSIVAVNYFYTEWKIYLKKNIFLEQVRAKFSKQKINNTYNAKFLLLKTAFYQSFYLDECKISLSQYENTKKTYDPMWLQKHVLEIVLQVSFKFLLPLNVFVFMFVSMEYFSEQPNIKIFLECLQGIWVVYLNIFFIIFLTFWSKFQNKYLGKWINVKLNDTDIIVDKKIKKTNKKFSRKALKNKK